MSLIADTTVNNIIKAPKPVTMDSVKVAKPVEKIAAKPKSEEPKPEGVAMWKYAVAGVLVLSLAGGAFWYFKIKKIKTWQTVKVQKACWVYRGTLDLILLL